ncbi:hypothetical protein FALBO_12443 [Fusarium albosuccineum]|uniref:Uncharacterized protein n=1 Tax=Fusarium albosuccineum TaxID=1237068 RepID=A0A8H4L3D0_9HYPO|nr:hypothetical protein FALBO_12443 [Fusarium albosuccineum]
MQPNENPQSIPESTGPAFKRRRSHSSQDSHKTKRQNAMVAQALLTPITLVNSAASQMTTRTFGTPGVFQSSHERVIKSPSSSWDPSPPASQKTLLDCFNDFEMDPYIEDLDDAMNTTVPETLASQGDEKYTFSLEEPDEDALAELLDEASADEYDPQLQHSSPQTNASTGRSNTDDPPLAEEIDWSNVQEHAHHVPKQGSVLHSLDKTISRSKTTKAQLASQRTSASCKSKAPATVGSKNPKPFVGQVLLKPYKTFFELQEMVDAKTQMFSNQPNVIFELFGRVLHSKRENFHKKQYFQFRSLLKERPPYLGGTLLGWEVGSLLDCVAQDFLNPQSSPAKCFCRCKLKREPQAEAGWIIQVIDIRPTTWKEIQGAMDVLGRKDLDEPVGSS